MASFDVTRMRVQSRVALDNASYPARKLIMIHSGVTIGVGLLLSVMSYFLDLGIAQTGGLGGIGTRTILETVQSLLQTANALLLPFWSIGYIRVILQWTRREDADLKTLLFGFRCLGPVMRLMILQGMIYTLLGMVGAYAGAAVFLMTPGAQPIYAIVQQMAEAGITDPNAMLENEAYISASMAMAPYMMGVAGLIVAPVAYRLRFAQFVLMDQPWLGALRSIIGSWRMTRKNCWRLLKLDLRYWWFYLAEGLIVALGYGELLLDMLGISLNMDADVIMFAFYAAALLCEFALYVWKKNELFAVYSLAYDQLNVPREEPQKPQPNHVPWNY